MVDLPAGKQEAAFSVITLPETFTEFEQDDFVVPELELDEEEQMHMGREDELTMQDDLFMEGDGSHEARLMMEDFGGAGGDGAMDADAAAGFAPMEIGRDGGDDFLEPEIGRDADISREQILAEDLTLDGGLDASLMGGGVKAGAEASAGGDYSFDVSRGGGGPDDSMAMEMLPDDGGDFPPLDLADLDGSGIEQQHQQQQPPLHMAIAPVNLGPVEDASSTGGTTTTTVRISRRKRKLVVDTETEISGAVMRQGLEAGGTRDITRSSGVEGRLAFDAPPPTRAAAKKRMLMEQGIELLFNATATQGWGAPLQDMLGNRMRWIVRRAPPPITSSGQATAVADENDAAQQQLFLAGDGGGDEFLPLDDGGEMPHFEEEGGAAAGLADSTFDVSAVGYEDAQADAGFGEPLADFTQQQQQQQQQQQGVEGEEGGAGPSEDYTGYSSRTAAFVKNIKGAFEGSETLSYRGMTKRATKRKAAAVLFELLVLKTKGFVDVDQKEPYADITVRATPQLATL